MTIKPVFVYCSVVFDNGYVAHGTYILFTVMFRMVAFSSCMVLFY